MTGDARATTLGLGLPEGLPGVAAAHWAVWPTVSVVVAQTSGRRPEPLKWRDRYFLVRSGPSGYEFPRSPRHFRRLPRTERDIPGTAWYIVCADHPAHVGDAWRDPGAVQAFFRGLDRDELFRARIELDGATWQDAETRLTELEQRG